ncbi:MAG: GatB/YqeY domain-containing protein [Verrucomicrobiota bacterium]|nr:GatB/YqeY domain-containing protein [Verrucomicrobiota bacterium]
MSLFTKVDADLKVAMLARDSLKVETLRMLKSAIKYYAIDKLGSVSADVSDDHVMEVVKKQIKQRRDSIESYESAGRAELADKEKKEMAILQPFLPVGLSAEELEVVVKAALQESGCTTKKQMGEAMKAVMAKVGGRAEGKAVSALVQKLLA